MFDTFDLDDFYIKSKNEFGAKQKIWFLSLVLVNLYAPFQMIQVVFTGLKPHFNCTIGNITYINNCDNKLKCDSVQYELYPDSFLKEWADSRCSSSVSQIIQAANMLGIMCGALTLGAVSDKLGRKKVMGYTLMAMLGFGILGSFSEDLIMYTGIRFLVGVCCSGNILSSFVLASELVGPSYRSLCGNLFKMAFAIGIMLYAGLAQLIQHDWRILSLTASLVGLLLLPALLHVPESPRWLYANGRIDEGVNVLERLSGHNLEEIEALCPSQPKGPDLITASGRIAKNVTIFIMLRKKFGLVIVQLISWFTNAVVYYALTLSSHHLGKNVYISTCLSGLVEIPAYILTNFLLQRVGRKMPLCVYMVAAGVACILLEFTDKNLYVGLFGKMCIAASFCIVFIHSSELFPTVVRNSGVGLCSAFARIGGVAASIFVGAEKGNIWPVIGLGILSIFSGFLNLTLPETLHKKLPETIEDLDEEEPRAQINSFGTGERDEEND